MSAQVPKSQRVYSMPDGDILDCFKNQKKNDEWTFYDERQLLENAVNQRVNFIIAAFALFVTAAATVESTVNLIVVLAVGFLLLSGLTLTTIRVYIRLDIVLRMLYKINPKNALKTVHVELKHREPIRLGPMVKWIYMGIPIFCTCLLLLGLIAACRGWIIPGGGDEPTHITNYNYGPTHQ